MSLPACPVVTSSAQTEHISRVANKKQLHKSETLFCIENSYLMPTLEGWRSFFLDGGQPFVHLPETSDEKVTTG